MNATDPWTAFAEVFGDDIACKPLTDDELQRLADEYQREQIASAQSEAAYAANVKDFAK